MTSCILWVVQSFLQSGSCSPSHIRIKVRWFLSWIFMKRATVHYALHKKVYVCFNCFAMHWNKAQIIKTCILPDSSVCVRWIFSCFEFIQHRLHGFWVSILGWCSRNRLIVAVYYISISANIIGLASYCSLYDCVSLLQLVSILFL